MAESAERCFMFPDNIEKCRRCFRSDMLYPDPAAYFPCAAILPPHPQAGAPLLCRWCGDATHPTVVNTLRLRADHSWAKCPKCGSKKVHEQFLYDTSRLNCVCGHVWHEQGAGG